MPEGWAPVGSCRSSPAAGGSWPGRSTSAASGRSRAGGWAGGTGQELGGPLLQARTPGESPGGQRVLELEGGLEVGGLSDYHHQDFGDQSTTPRPLVSRRPASL